SLGLLPLPPDYIGPLTVRPILLTNNIPYNGAFLQFGCGFFCYSVPCDTGYLFATFLAIYGEDDTHPSDLQMVWSANRERLLEHNATLGLTSNGNLVLKDADGTLVWSTNTHTEDFQGMRIEESGNLALLNNSNGTLWQSFDYPADKFLLGQKLKVGQKLIGNSSPTNTSPGKSVTDYLSDFTDALTVCDYPRPCGDYGICTDSQCSCPKEANAFDQIDVSKPNLGCIPQKSSRLPKDPPQPATKIISFW
ncbi:hypothetical protein KI387_034422, partial [Taxus chinensis]